MVLGQSSSISLSLAGLTALHAITGLQRTEQSVGQVGPGLAGCVGPVL